MPALPPRGVPAPTPQAPALGGRPRVANPAGGGTIIGDPHGSSPGNGAGSFGTPGSGLGGPGAAGGSVIRGPQNSGFNPNGPPPPSGGIDLPGGGHVYGDPHNMGQPMSGTPPWMDGSRMNFSAAPHQVKKTANGHVWAPELQGDMGAAENSLAGGEAALGGNPANTASGMGFSFGGNPANTAGGMGFTMGGPMSTQPAGGIVGGAKPDFVEADPQANRMQLAQLLARRGRM